ncbi:Superkiller viralicidic activity 2-like 2 [Strongyloides ratti]|uniref:Superkiller viralicidic activity 2-like 2 n=1 Tax=Strongyloides ratti TaxID=34506 RepID=A0A090KZY8_STRRB|nr:Superkiller viralicidic activity 2-like 2 [Strongyloides ratti]CEF61447.1 Superkiller viralicidic activity 2-like 2 [Strongyloides ratti]
MISSAIILNEQNCLHEVFYDESSKPSKLGSKPKHDLRFGYELDIFQVQSNLAVDNNESVLIATHTSAGKTSIARYVINSCLEAKKRCFYTTPLKALSNQKYHEFKKIYNNVGLITGDVFVNVNALIVILTIEVLNEIIINDSLNFTNAGYVIMDEGHFLGDEARGHVWEESIINMPKDIKLAILSATLQNCSEFAKWIVYIKGNPMHVIGTNERPITLEYCVHCSATGRIIQIKVGTDETDSEGLETAMIECQGKNRGKKELMELLKILKDEDMLPAIIYCPSKKTCDSMAKLISSMCFLDTVERDLMNELLKLTLFLEDEEMKTFMSEIEDYAVCLTNGIGVHHGSLMKMTKEFMEKCFINGGIKVMFSTETLAVGLNIPARSVIFTSVYKFDGNVRRTYKQSEFIQMAGRAGRRGIDSLGHAIFSLTDSNR